MQYKSFKSYLHRCVSGQTVFRGGGSGRQGHLTSKTQADQDRSYSKGDIRRCSPLVGNSRVTAPASLAKTITHDCNTEAPRETWFLALRVVIYGIDSRWIVGVKLDQPTRTETHLRTTNTRSMNIPLTFPASRLCRAGVPYSADRAQQWKLPPRQPLSRQQQPRSGLRRSALPPRLPCGSARPVVVVAAAEGVGWQSVRHLVAFVCVCGACGMGGVIQSVVGRSRKMNISATAIAAFRGLMD